MEGPMASRGGQNGPTRTTRPEPDMKFKKRVGLNRVIGLIWVEKSGFRVTSVGFGLPIFQFFEPEPD